MDLLTIFEGIPNQPQDAIRDLKKNISAKDVAATHIEPNLKAMEENAGQELDPLYIAYMLQYVVENSKNG